PIVSAAAIAPLKKKTGKDKVEVVVKEKEKRKRTAASGFDKELVTKKQRTQKNRAPKVRKLVLQVEEEYEEETYEEPLQRKRKRSESEG
ncbi:hypothetical protein A2U01_0049853, partial [Trifolium medium]|nr:hypothetical protein [Trifolium medium]